MRGVVGGLLGGAAIALGIAACHPPAFLTGPRLSGTCGGACDHYFACKGGHQSDRAQANCVADCQGVFSDDESLRAFESLSCDDTVEYVEGLPANTASAGAAGARSNARR